MVVPQRQKHNSDNYNKKKNNVLFPRFANNFPN